MPIVSLKTLHQIIRYYLSGILINLLGYGAFVALLQFGFGAKSSSAFLFCLSMLLTFIVNRAYVFKSDVAVGASFLAYVATSGVVLGMNLGMLFVFVDVLGKRAELVQFFSIIVVSGFLFLTNKFLVHRAGT